MSRILLQSPQGSPRTPLRWLPVMYQRYIPVVYSLHNPRGLTSSRIRLSYQSILFHVYALQPPAYKSPHNRYSNICSVVIDAIVLIYSLSKIGTATALAAHLASLAARFFTARAAALAAFSASARTLYNTLSRPSLADIRPPFKTTCWLLFYYFAYVYTATCILYRSSSANA